MALCVCGEVYFLKNIIHKSGSVTVEAAYIVPLILMITLALLYSVMIGHDRGVTYIELRRYSEKLSGSLSSEKEEFDVMRLQRKMLICHIDYINVESKSRKVVIKGRMTSRIGPGRLSNCCISFQQIKNDMCKNVRKRVIQNE